MEEKKKSLQVQTLTAIRGFYEKCTQTIENADFLILRFLHTFEKMEKGEEN